MQFFSIIIYGYFVLAIFLIYAIGRDRTKPTVFFGQHKNWALGIIVILMLGVLFALDANFIEPWTIKTTPVDIKISGITTSIKIAFISDIQVGNHKKSAWVEKIVERIKQEKPDMLILGGDLIDNGGTFEDESVYLEPLRAIAAVYPTFAVLGNHEYGIGSGVVGFDQYYTGDRSAEVIERLKNLNIKLLRNDLACPEIKGQKLCLYGIDDLWGGQPNFNALALLSPPARGGVAATRPGWWENPLIFITHNPDGIKLWPKNLRAPDLTLAGHTHGGQVWLPLIGPLGDAGITLPKKYYRGLNYYSPSVILSEAKGRVEGSTLAIPAQAGIESPIDSSATLRSAQNDNKTPNNIPIYTSVGIGESGGAVRFLTLPEITIINIKPSQ